MINFSKFFGAIFLTTLFTVCSVYAELACPSPSLAFPKECPIPVSFAKGVKSSSPNKVDFVIADDFNVYRRTTYGSTSFASTELRRITNFSKSQTSTSAFPTSILNLLDENFEVTSTNGKAYTILSKYNSISAGDARYIAATGDTTQSIRSIDHIRSVDRTIIGVRFTTSKGNLYFYDFATKAITLTENIALNNLISRVEDNTAWVYGIVKSGDTRFASGSAVLYKTINNQNTLPGQPIIIKRADGQALPRFIDLQPAILTTDINSTKYEGDVAGISVVGNTMQLWNIDFQTGLAERVPGNIGTIQIPCN